MRMMSYKMHLEADGGYLIANAECDWNNIPLAENYKAPGLRIIYEKSHRGILTANLDDCIEPAFFNREDTDPVFRGNYIKALHGNLPGWKLAGVMLNPFLVTCILVNAERQQDEILYIAPSSEELKFTIETISYDGNRTDQYLVEASACENAVSGIDRFMKVTEYYKTGKRVIVFENGSFMKTAQTHDSWKDVYVVEYR